MTYIKDKRPIKSRIERNIHLLRPPCTLSYNVVIPIRTERLCIVWIAQPKRKQVLLRIKAMKGV